MKDGVWGQMLRKDPDTSRVRSIVEDDLTQKIGKGDTILFWYNKWCEDGPFFRVFPRLFSLSIQKDCFLNQMGIWHDGTWSWNLIWRRPLLDWEKDDVGRLLNCIGLKAPRIDSIDGVVWKDSDFCSFPSTCINQKVYESSQPILPKRIINITWHNHTPPRAQLTL